MMGGLDKCMGVKTKKQFHWFPSTFQQPTSTCSPPRTRSQSLGRREQLTRRLMWLVWNVSGLVHASKGSPQGLSAWEAWNKALNLNSTILHAHTTPYISWHVDQVREEGKIKFNFCMGFQKSLKLSNLPWLAWTSLVPPLVIITKPSLRRYMGLWVQGGLQVEVGCLESSWEPIALLLVLTPMQLSKPTHHVTCGHFSP